MKTTRVLAAAEDESNEEAAMDIPPPSHTTTPSPTAGSSSLAAPFNYASAFQNLSERFDIISLDVYQMRLDH